MPAPSDALPVLRPGITVTAKVDHFAGHADRRRRTYTLEITAADQILAWPSWPAVVEAAARQTQADWGPDWAVGDVSVQAIVGEPLHLIVDGARQYRAPILDEPFMVAAAEAGAEYRMERAAGARAHQLLLSLLTPAQAAQWVAERYIALTGSDRHTYHLNPGRSGNVWEQTPDGWKCWCAAPAAWLPADDILAAQYLYLRYAAPAFKAGANLMGIWPEPYICFGVDWAL